MEFEKLVSPSLKDLFISHIEAMILSGELPVGQKLPPERQLAQSMGVSRAVVNSGVVELERRGFLEIRPRVGTFVADYRRAGTLETLKSIMTYNRGRLRNEEIRSILEVRDALDKLAVTCMLPDVTDEEVDILAEKADAIRLASDNRQAAEAAFAFQHELAMLSGPSTRPSWCCGSGSASSMASRCCMRSAAAFAPISGSGTYPAPWPGWITVRRRPSPAAARSIINTNIQITCNMLHVTACRETPVAA